MSDRVKNIAFYVVAVVLILGIGFAGFLAYRNFKAVKSVSTDVAQETIAPPEVGPMPEEMEQAVAVSDDNISQPTGYGVTRPLTKLDDGNVPGAGLSGVGDLEFNVDTDLVIRGSLGAGESAETINSYVKKAEPGKYECYVNWSRSKELSTDMYSTLVATVGMILEDEMNMQSPGRYEVIAEDVPVSALIDGSVTAVYEVDEWGFLTIVADVTIRDLQEETEVEELKAYTLYYDDAYLAIRK